jgi:PP-loop superfamily ATP-utilizing enzyme
MQAVGERVQVAIVGAGIAGVSDYISFPVLMGVSEYYPDLHDIRPALNARLQDAVSTREFHRDLADLNMNKATLAEAAQAAGYFMPTDAITVNLVRANLIQEIEDGMFHRVEEEEAE